MIFEVNTINETTKLGSNLGKMLKPGDVICLTGDLGTGKTLLLKL